MLELLFNRSQGKPMDNSASIPNSLWTRCLTHDANDTIKHQYYLRAADANGEHCDTISREMVTSDPDLRIFKIFLNQSQKHRKHTTIAISNFERINQVLQDGACTLQDAHNWAKKAINKGISGTENVRNLPGWHASLTLLLYHFFNYLGYNVTENLTAPGSMLQLKRSHATWAGTGLNSQRWAPSKHDSGKWELSWSFGAFFFQHHTLAFQ